MSRFARIVDGRVAEIIVPPEGLAIEEMFHPAIAATCHELQSSDVEAVQPGWIFNGTNFSAPIVAAPELVPVTVVTARTFRERFTRAERGAITLAASKALDAEDPTLQVFVDDLNAAGNIVDLNHPDLLAGVALLVDLKLITPQRAEQLLSTAPLP
jgi:hypothetical protein